MMFVCSIGNVFDYSTLDDRSGSDALADEPGQVDGRINTDRREFLGIINPRGQLLVRNRFELNNLLAYVYIFIGPTLTYIRHNVFVPGVWLGQFRKPFAGIRLLIFLTVVDKSAWIPVRIARVKPVDVLHIPRK
jgi:hypothetical protein